MTELERIAVAIRTNWRAEGGADQDPIPVPALLDRVLPYRVARRTLGIDASEDYEALLLRLLAEEEELLRVTPVDAAELARATCASKLPDLGVLQLLRSAAVTLSPRTLQLDADDKPEMPVTAEPAPASFGAGSPPAAKASPRSKPMKEVVTVAPALRCWSCAESLPVNREVKFCPFCGADQRQPTCGACGALAERGWKHCPDCGVSL